MKIRGTLTFKGENAAEMVTIIARSLEPDNVQGICTDIEKATVNFSADKIGTMLSSVDDYLMNAAIVEKLSCLLKEDFM